jgi:corrinoid protein of di/trimethylamine methyltransferase
MTEAALLQEITQSIVEGDSDFAVQAAQAALDDGVDPMTLLNEGLIPGADEVGRLFSTGEYFLPELMLTGRALKAAMQVVQPQLMEKYAAQVGARRVRVVMATVQSDIHDIGKSLVASMLSAAGFDIIDLGVDVPIKAIIEKAEESGAAIIALSALLTTSLPYIQDVIELLKARHLREKYLVIVGGAGVTPEWAAQIEADGTAPNAADAVGLVQRLLATA